LEERNNPSSQMLIKNTLLIPNTKLVAGVANFVQLAAQRNNMLT